MKAVLGIDIGGTKIAAGLVTAEGAVLHSRTARTPAREGAAAVLAQALRLARAVCADGVEIMACGVGSAGTIDARGVVTHATGALPGWTGTDLRSAFSSALRLPVQVLNDVHAWALGEARFGAAAGAADALVVTVGTGIGGAIVREGRVVRGATGSAGSIGHIPAPSSVSAPAARSRRCPCGRIGHLEAYASGPGILATFRERGGTADDLATMEGALADEVIDEAATLLGRALAGAITVLDPEIVVIGGGVALLGDRLMLPLARAVGQEALPGPDRVTIRPAALAPAGGIVGAATAAM
ncbi:ROK family protein [Nonomuraea sp. NPDC049152]|uniref:ROK family protein n=1 Tax=Nonomuraea sp. NPDC049152 TaxID=3154350 RepID=UPI0033CE0960